MVVLLRICIITTLLLYHEGPQVCHTEWSDIYIQLVLATLRESHQRHNRHCYLATNPKQDRLLSNTRDQSDSLDAIDVYGSEKESVNSFLKLKVAVLECLNYECCLNSWNIFNDDHLFEFCLLLKLICYVASNVKYTRIRSKMGNL